MIVKDREFHTLKADIVRALLVSGVCVCQIICLSVHLFVCPSVCLSFHLSVHLSVCLSVKGILFNRTKYVQMEAKSSTTQCPHQSN